MKHTISNTHLEVSVLQKGTEICSIKSLYTGIEYMWQADPEVWGSHAPVLFPAIGAIKNKEATINGKSYAVPRHGFIRHNEHIKLQSSTDQSLTYQLNYSDETLKVFPYKFSFEISFSLEANKLTVSHKVHNLDDQTIYFCLGGHPAFACPLHEGESYEDYFLEFGHNETADTIRLSDDGLLTDHKERILTNQNTLPLRPDLFDQDALVFKDLTSKKVSLKSLKSDQQVIVSYPDFPYLGIWAKPNASFVCIEPWLGTADHAHTDGDFTKKEGIVMLPKGEVFCADYSIEIKE
ncbi:MAG: aldose 1-epimerase family protein [Cyclobacteriaceae bacterium]